MLEMLILQLESLSMNEMLNSCVESCEETVNTKHLGFRACTDIFSSAVSIAEINVFFPRVPNVTDNLTMTLMFMYNGEMNDVKRLICLCVQAACSVWVEALWWHPPYTFDEDASTPNCCSTAASVATAMQAGRCGGWYFAYQLTVTSPSVVRFSFDVCLKR